MRRHPLPPPEPPPPSPPRAAPPHRRLDPPSPADRAGARERVLPEERADHARPGTCPRGDPARRAAGGARDRTLRPRHSEEDGGRRGGRAQDRKSTRLNSSHLVISYAVFCLKKKKKKSTKKHS